MPRRSEYRIRRARGKIDVSPASPGRPTPTWIKARASIANNACVELAKIGEMIAVRDSKRPELPPHQYTRLEILAFFDGVRNGEFDHLLDS